MLHTLLFTVKVCLGFAAMLLILQAITEHNTNEKYKTVKETNLVVKVLVLLDYLYLFNFGKHLEKVTLSNLTIITVAFMILSLATVMPTRKFTTVAKKLKVPQKYAKYCAATVTGILVIVNAVTYTILI